MLLLQQTITDFLTDPKDHNQENGNFLYIVHGINPYFLEDKDRLNERLGNYFRRSFHYNASLVGDVRDENIKRSIGGNHPTKEVYRVGFWNDIALLLIPQPEDVQVAWYSDISTPTDQQKLSSWIKRNKGKILPAYDLLTREMIHFNHLVLSGNPHLKISGIAIRRPTQESTLGELVECLYDLAPDSLPESLPVIQLRSKYPFWMEMQKCPPIDPLESRREFQEYPILIAAA